jgi:Spy/CpxP family protein refolding chaperone
MLKRALVLSFTITLVIITVNSVFAKMMESAKPRLSTKEQRMNKIQARIISLNKKLNLSDLQRKQITDILTKVKGETTKMLEDTGEDIRNAKAQGEEEIEKVLTKEQRDKFNNVREQEEDEDVVKVFKSSY